MTQHYVDPNRVFVARAHERDIVRQVELLQKQGQIEPLLVSPYSGVLFEYTVSTDEYLYAGAQVMAARRLKWPTILVETQNVTSG